MTLTDRDAPELRKVVEEMDVCDEKGGEMRSKLPHDWLWRWTPSVPLVVEAAL